VLPEYDRTAAQTRHSAKPNRTQRIGACAARTQDAWAAGNTGDALMHALHSAVFNDAVQEVTSCARARIFVNAPA
jgi:hypothetical protein